MADKLGRVAVDTCVILDLLVADDDARAARAEYLLGGHSTRHMVVLPAIVVAEIGGTPRIRAPQGPEAADAARRMNAAKDWIRDSNFMVAELSERIARRAADLAMEHQLKAPDASVLATAELVRCARLYTRDKQMLKYSGKFGFAISEPDDPPKPPPDLFNHDA